MFTKTRRIIKSGALNFWRNGWLTTATVLIMTITLVVWTTIFLTNVVMTSVLATLSEKVDISVYFALNTQEPDILGLKSKLENLKEVASINYVSSEKALEIFKNKHGGDDVLIKSVEVLDQNPLEASLNILAKDASQYESIASFINKDEFKKIVSKINYGENKIVIDRLNNIIRVVRQTGFGASLALAFVAFLVAFNTVRLAIYSSREEITIMKLVGASNRFVRGPFLIEGFLHGVSASVFSFLLVFPGINIISPKLYSFLPEINLLQYFLDNFWAILVFQTIGGIALGVFSGWVAVRKYLNV